MKISPKAKKILLKDENALRIARKAKRSLGTIKKWLYADSPYLTMKPIIEEMMDITGFSEEELFDV